MPNFAEEANQTAVLQPKKSFNPRFAPPLVVG
jgi:hypothetical protein